MNKCKWKDGKFIMCEKMGVEFPTAGNDDNGRTALKITDSLIFDFCPFCGADIRKPVEIKVGMFGKFWDDREKDGYYSVLTSTSSNGFHDGSSVSWAHFIPGLPEGFNQDGTPKENEDE